MRSAEWLAVKWEDYAAKIGPNCSRSERSCLPLKRVSKDNLRVRRELRNLENAFNPGVDDENDDNTRLRRLHAR